MMLKDYFIYAATNHDEDPIYLFDDKFGNRDETKSLLDDYEVPIYFKVSKLTTLVNLIKLFKYVARFF